MLKSLLCLLPTAAIFADEGMPPQQGSLMSTFIMIAIALAFFYLILWRPEQKRRKAAEQMRNSLKKGDRVTAMGIVGKVDRIQEHTVILKMVDGSKIEVIKAAITDVQASSEEEGRKSEPSSEA